MTTRKRKHGEGDENLSTRKKRLQHRQSPAGGDAKMETSGDECDLLAFLDEERECECAGQRSRRRQAKHELHRHQDDDSDFDNVENDDDCADNLTQLQMNVDPEVLKGCVRVTNASQQRQYICDMEMDPSDDDSDLLKSLDENRKRELAKLRSRRYRAKQKPRTPIKNGDDFENGLDEDERAECLRRLQMSLGPDGLDECVCVACDRVALRREATRVNDTDLRYIRLLKSCLGVKCPDIPTALVEQYQAPRHLASLRDILISPRGINEYVNENGSLRSWISVCKECDRSISQGKLPKFAVANGFFVGRLPAKLTKLTIPERFMTQLTTISALTRVMRGGRHRCIRSHCMAFDCTSGPPVTLLPRSLESVASYRVVMVGEFTTAQAVEVRKLHQIRNKLVRDALAFYTANNHLYKETEESVSVDVSDYTEDQVDEALVEHVSDPGCRLEEGINSEQENVCGESDAWRVAYEEDECRVIERRIGLRDEETHPRVREHPVTANVDNERERSFEIRKSDHVASDVSGDLFGRLFPHLFPFGRGYPGEHRQTAVSVQECVKYYSMLSTRQFAEDELFMLVAFDRLSLRNMYIQNYFRCQRHPSALDGYENLTGEQLGRALLANERRRQGCLPWRPAEDSAAQRFLKSVEITSRSVWGSNAERTQCRHKAFAFQTRYGQPALFITLTPNTDNSLVLAQYTGISSVDTLFDLLDARLPSKADLREASRNNDCASARLFMRNVDVFIQHALGIDPATRKQLPFRGLFGDVKAYFGMVETQGRGTLHIHFLIWLNNCPPNSAATEEILRSQRGINFREQVVSYADRIVQTELPVPISSCACSNCGAEFSRLRGLSIPDLARKDPQKPRQKARSHNVAEPLLVECQECGVQFSSQHLIRNMLLRFRPRSWPEWERPLGSKDVDDLVRREAPCRDTALQAANIISERETMHASYCANSQTHESGVLSAELLHQANSRQMPLFKKDDDPFRNDELTRLLELSPASPADERLSKRSLDYMVSVLAVLLNQHLWSHTTSCFKQSGVTPNDSFCRYRFPHDRVENTSFESSGVELKRTLGHEYMNGFNYELMAAFKCNHDIQILLGGSGVTDRIYYCCKYITKQQKQVDSQVAVAVAALDRRRQRENNAASLGSVLNTHDMAQKRVAALAYNMTNRVEIAGPLAALYIYRGSCCYASAKTATLLLGEIVRQLTKSEVFSCSLVCGNTDSAVQSTFRAVAPLDDYCFRPKALEAVNLYEFTMKYFRKKCSLRSTLTFLDRHPLSRTHCLGKRSEEVVPIIQGFRLPSIIEDATLEKRCKYAVLSLVLFMPFRSLSDLIGDSNWSDAEVWIHAYEQWKPKRSEFVVEIMNNMDDFHSGFKKAKAKSEHAAVGPQSDEQMNNVANDNDELYSDAIDGDFNDSTVDEGPTEDLRRLWDDYENEGVVPESAELDPTICPTSTLPPEAIGHMMDLVDNYNILSGSAEKVANESHDEFSAVEFPSVVSLKSWVKDGDTDNAIAPTESKVLIGHDTQVVELLNDALLAQPSAWRPSKEFCRSPKITKHFASISYSSRVYTLNERQHLAFVAIAQSLLLRWRLAETSTEPGDNLALSLRENQLLLFLGGEGGTGKSRVVEAVQAFCQSWGRPQSILKTALTGKAATIIKGCTLAGFLLQLRKRQACDSLLSLDLVIIDEVSMMKKFQLAQLDTRLRGAKMLPHVPFGGVHIVLAGDFLQLPPVGGEPIFKDPKTKPNPSVNEIAGYNLWRAFTTVVILKESIRFNKDPEWGLGCQQARRGVWSPEFVRIINSRVLTNEEEMNESICAGTTCVTPDNSTRVSINKLFISTAAKLLSNGDYPVRVVANFKGKLSGLRSSEVQMIMALPDTKFGRMAPYLDLIVGMPIQVTQNIRAAKMVANGTVGRLEKIIYHRGTTFRLVHDSTADIIVKIPSLPPPVVIIRVDRGPSAKPILGCTNADLFPLFFDSESYNTSNVVLAGTMNGVPRSLSVKIQQFPLVCAVSSTVYKVQGETLDSMVITEWRSSCRMANKSQQPYLLVSRVTSRAAFVALSPLTSEIIAWAHPPREALVEEDRLDQLSNETIQRLTSG